jgi:hypothetical protein
MYTLETFKAANEAELGFAALSRKVDGAGSVSLSDGRGNTDYCVRMLWDALNKLSKTTKCTDADLILFKATADHPHMKQNT